MSKFKILTLAEFISQEGIETSIEAFAELYHAVTSKHQRNMQMTIITKGTMDDFIMSKVKKMDLGNVVNMLHWDEQEAIEDCYHNASLMLLPQENKISKLVEECLSFGLPVICFDDERLDEVLDSTCGMMVDRGGMQQNVVSFSEVLRMLYFDQEAVKILSKGASKKYEAQLSWGTV